MKIWTKWFNNIKWSVFHTRIQNFICAGLIHSSRFAVFMYKIKYAVMKMLNFANNSNKFSWNNIRNHEKINKKCLTARKYGWVRFIELFLSIDNNIDFIFSHENVGKFIEQNDSYGIKI